MFELFNKNKVLSQRNYAVESHKKVCGVHHIDGLKLYGPFFINLSKNLSLQETAAIEPNDIVEGETRILAYSPELNRVNEDFREVLGFLDKDSLSDKLIHVAFYTENEPKAYNEQTFPYEGTEVWWPADTLTEGKLPIFPALVGYKGEVNICAPLLFRSLKAKLHSTIYKLPEDQRMLYNSYLTIVCKEMTHSLKVHSH